MKQTLRIMTPQSMQIESCAPQTNQATNVNTNLLSMDPQPPLTLPPLSHTTRPLYSQEPR